MTTSLYTYGSLDSRPGAISLLKVCPPCSQGHVRCELRNKNLNISAYKALHYVRGSPRETYLIEMDGKEWRVRKSLFTFLRKAQNEFPDQLLWVDALCIDQSNVQERNQQVQQMCKF